MIIALSFIIVAMSFKKLLKIIAEANDEIYLLSHGCDLQLYRLVCKAKERLRHAGQPALAMRVEGSTKVLKPKGEVIKGRYTITVLLSEFLNYDIQASKEILDSIGFTLDEVSNLIPKDSNYDTDIIFGKDNNIGKVYFDTGKNIRCYESSGKIKYYKLVNKDPLTFKVKIKDSVKVTHTFLKHRLEYDGYTVYCIANGKDFETYYTRPGFAPLLFIMDLYYAY